MFVSFRLLVVESIQAAWTSASAIMYSVKARRFVSRHAFRQRSAKNLKLRVSATPLPRWTITPLFYSRRPTCPFSAGRRPATEHQKGPRPVVYEINLRFRRFSCGTGQITGLTPTTLLRDPARRLVGSRARVSIKLANSSPAAISPCTITMDHDAIICFMTDGLTRAPDADVHGPSVGSQKYPSYNVDVIYL